MAATALETYWDATRDLVFLGPWCLLPSREHVWGAAGAKLVASRWNDPQTRSERLAVGYQQALAMFERMLPELARRLNQELKVSHEIRWWRLVVGPWLMTWSHVVLERTWTVEDALAELGEAEMYAPPPMLEPCRDTLAFLQELKGDRLNLRLYADIMRALDRPVLEGPELPAPSIIEAKRPPPLRRAAATGVRALEALRGNSVLLHRSSYLPRAAVVALARSTMGAVLPLLAVAPEHVAPVINPELRKRLSAPPRDAGDAERIAWRLLGDYLPVVFAEGFASAAATAAGGWPPPPTAVLSLSAWYYDEPFKRWAADAAQTGTILLGGQHGANYGAMAFHPGEYLERSIVDRYYSWGWDEPTTGAATALVKPMPAGLLLGRARLAADRSATGALLVGTVVPRYSSSLPWISADFVDYLDWQRRFACALSPDMRTLLTVRLHREDMGWETAGRWREFCPDVRQQGWDISFDEALATTRVYVCDHMSTTYAEALAARKPTLLFWNPSANPVRPAAVAAFDALRATGILHDNPESAAMALMSVYEDVDIWWNEPARQAAVDAFCDQFARTAEDGVAQWLGELRGVLRDGLAD